MGALPRNLFYRPVWLPAKATEQIDFTAKHYWVGRRRVLSADRALANAGWTVARAGVATVVNSDKQVVAAAANAPRIDYSPVDASIYGLLIEGARQNIAADNLTLSGYATSNGISLTTNAGTAPDGTVTATRIAETATTNLHATFKGSQTWTTQAYVFSCFLKADDRIWGGPYWLQGASEVKTWFDTSTGAISTSTVGVARMVQYSGGWWRASTRAALTAAGSQRLGVSVSSGNNVNSYTGTLGSGLYAWGMQVEPGAQFPSSLIPIVGAGPVTRAADVVSRTIVQPTKIACSFQVRTPTGTAGNQTIWSIGDTTNGIVLRRESDGHIRYVGFASGSTVLTVDLGGVGTLGVHRVAVYADGTVMRVAINGAAPVSNNQAIPTLTTFVERLGSSYVAGEEFFGHIQTYTVFSDLSPAQMSAVTSPGVYIHALMGIDSLTVPTQTGYGQALRDIMWGRYGVASAGWIGLINSNASRTTGMFWDSGGELSRTNIKATTPYTIDTTAHFWATTDGSTLSFYTPKEPYDSVTMVYISEPGGAGFNFQIPGNSTNTLSSDAALAAHAVSYEAFTNPNAQVSWRTVTGGGPLTIVGANFSRVGAKGFTYSPLGDGGYAVHDFAQLDNTAMQTIFAAIRPTHFLFNGGMNDRGGHDATVYEADVRHIVDNLLAAVPSCKIIMINSLEPGDAGTSYYLDYIPVKQALAVAYGGQYVDLRSASASTVNFATANAAGLMLVDQIHPTVDCNTNILAPYLANTILW
jgi:hypothetical protein